MSTPVPPDSNRLASWRPSRRVLLVAAIAFAIGLLLFVLLWMNDRGDGFYRAQAPAQGVEGQQFEPLPAPLPAGDAASASGMGTPNEEVEQSTGIIETPRPAPPPPAAPPAPPAPVAMAPTDAPVPIQSPAPRYPQDALRNGESGTVLVRVHVGPDGVPVAVDLVQSSRSRSLDRAASETVRSWRFLPAQRNGQPVNGVVEIPITFSANR